MITRDQWGARAAKGSINSVAPYRRSEFFVHYLGPGKSGADGSLQMRQVQRYHQDSNGWSDIGYNVAADQRGNKYEARGWDKVGAHCPNHNVSGYGCLVMIGQGEEPSPAALRAVRELYEEACARSGKRLVMKGHRDGKATACPGEPLYQWVRAGMPVDESAPAPSPAPAPAPTPQPYGDDMDRLPVLRRGATGQSVRNWQGLLVAAGRKVVVDGDFGPATDAATREWQAAASVPGGADGIVGPNTWGRALGLR